MLTEPTRELTMGQPKRGKGRPAATPEGPLEVWFAESGTSYEDVAHQVDITAEWLRAIARGTKKTNERVARMLCLITGRKVSTDQILDYFEQKQESQ